MHISYTDIYNINYVSIYITIYQRIIGPSYLLHINFGNIAYKLRLPTVILFIYQVLKL